jgi:hypothetical protein
MTSQFPELEIAPAVAEQILSQDWSISDKGTALAFLTMYGIDFDSSFLEHAPAEDRAELLLRKQILEQVLLDHECKKALVALAPAVRRS